MATKQRPWPNNAKEPGTDQRKKHNEGFQLFGLRCMGPLRKPKESEEKQSHWTA